MTSNGGDGVTVRRRDKVDIVGMRASNEAMLLRRIWLAECVSRAELARETGLSASTVSSIVGRFAEDGLVRLQEAGPSRGGRPPVMVAFADDAYCIVGVEMGATHVTVAVTDLRGRILAEEYTPFATREQPEGTLALLVRSVRSCRARAGAAGIRCLGVGVAVPSPLDARRPGELSALILPAWQGINLAERLVVALGLPVVLENDANAGALAERWFGIGGDDFTFIKVGTGIGAGHVMSGALYRGATGIAGEMGHLAIDPAGPPCSCGNRGCLHVLAGTPALLQLAAAVPGLEHPPTSALEIVAACNAGAPWAVEIVARLGGWLGIGIAGLVNLLNPSHIILGGEIVQAGEALLTPLRASASARSLLFSASHVEIRATSLGPAATAIGAGALMLDRALDDLSFFVSTAQEVA
jgi:predicted NBD/HSP70 family sugar kinase